jgi:hypothetical protein
MRKIILALGLLLCAAGARGQSTTVSGQVTDAGSQSWNSGVCQFQFVPNPQIPTFPSYTWTGGTLPQVVPCTMNGSGAYSVSVPSSTAISPGGSKWILQVTPNATSPSFSTPATTITGGTQTLNVTPPAIAITWSNPPGAQINAYSDAEIIGAPKGAQYFNVTIGFTRFWNGTVWATQGSGSGTVTGTGTVGFIPKWNGTTSLTNSLCDEGVTTANQLTCTDTAGAQFVRDQTGSSPPVVTAGTGGSFICADGNAPSVAASAGGVSCNSDGTTHVFNNGVDAGSILSANGVTPASSPGAVTAPVQVGFVSCTQATCAGTATTLFTTGASSAQYRVDVTADCTTSSAAATAIVTIGYTDPSGTAQTITASTATCTTLGASSIGSIVAVFSAENGTNIQYHVTVASTPSYQARVSLYQESTL